LRIRIVFSGSIASSADATELYGLPLASVSLYASLISLLQRDLVARFSRSTAALARSAVARTSLFRNSQVKTDQAFASVITALASSTSGTFRKSRTPPARYASYLSPASACNWPLLQINSVEPLDCTRLCFLKSANTRVTVSREVPII
jgi:hypothetical protein